MLLCSVLLFKIIPIATIKTQRLFQRVGLILNRQSNILSISGFQICQDFDVQYSVISDKPIRAIMHNAYA